MSVFFFLCVCLRRFQESVDMFSLALKYNPTVGRYYENRSKAFRKILNLREAREDFICLLILDPDNDEVSSRVSGMTASPIKM